MKLTYTVKNNKYENVKQVLKEEFNMSDRLILKLKSNQKIYKNNEITSINSKIDIDDQINALLDIEEDSSNIIPIKINGFRYFI